MTLIRHEFEGEKVESIGKDDLRFMLMNRKGSYLCLSSGKKSRYDGFFWYDGNRMFKIIDDIKALQAPEPIRITNMFSHVERSYSNFSETFFVPYSKDGMNYKLSQQHAMVFDFDIRESYDSRKWGAAYEITEEQGCLVISYTKQKDNREDKSEGMEYALYVAIKSDGKMQKIGEWVKKIYDTDASRHSEPAERYTYRAFEIDGTRASIGVSWNKMQAIETAKEIFDKNEELLSKQEEEDRQLLGWHLEHPQLEMAFRCAISSLYGLCTENGILAGLPWFFQVWNRDQSISARAMMLQKKYSYCKKIMLDSIKIKDKDGRIANIQTNAEQTGSADATGWSILRISDLLTMIENDGQVKLYFTKPQIQQLVEKIEGIVDEVTRNKAKSGLVTNSAQETWMDSLFGNDVRSGARIEIQALQIAAYKTLFKLTGKKFYSALAESTKKSVKKNFWNGKWLNDGVGDETIRPNFFIAYYCAPEILDKDEWNLCFQLSLQKLWNEWGGLSTIDKGSPLYTEHHTGEDSESYHRGDSWFWLNNLAAICLYRHDYEKYKMEVERLLHASTQEILFHGCIGHHSELSSSNEMKAEGCFAQAWSAAMFVELVHEMLVKENNN